MKVKILTSFIVIIFFVLFFIFYKGLENSNIYEPNFTTKKIFHHLMLNYLVKVT